MGLHLHQPAADRAHLLARLDVQPCSCRLEYVQDDDDPGAWHLLPCPHALAAPDHGLSLAEWAELERLLCPDDYTDPPPPPHPALALTPEARVAVYRRRAGPKGVSLSLYHSGDLWREEDTARPGVRPVRTANGATVSGGLADPPVAAPSLVDVLRAEIAESHRLVLLARERQAAGRRAA